jgi:hypothetical protein
MVAHFLEVKLATAGLSHCENDPSFIKSGVFGTENPGKNIVVSFTRMDSRLEEAVDAVAAAAAAAAAALTSSSSSSSSNIGFTCVTRIKDASSLCGSDSIVEIHVRSEGYASKYLGEKDPLAVRHWTDNLPSIAEFVAAVDHLARARNWHTTAIVARNDLDYRADNSGNTPLCVFVALSPYQIKLNMETACGLPLEEPYAFLVYDIWNEHGINPVDLYRRLARSRPANATIPDMWHHSNVVIRSVVEYTDVKADSSAAEHASIERHT